MAGLVRIFVGRSSAQKISQPKISQPVENLEDDNSYEWVNNVNEETTSLLTKSPPPLLILPPPNGYSSIKPATPISLESPLSKPTTPVVLDSLKNVEMSDSKTLTPKTLRAESTKVTLRKSLSSPIFDVEKNLPLSVPPLVSPLPPETSLKASTTPVAKAPITPLTKTPITPPTKTPVTPVAIMFEEPFSLATSPSIPGSPRWNWNLFFPPLTMNL